jgi:hypothetical protein
MSQIGIPGITKDRRTVRAPINPMDKATIFSIYPKEIIETKPTIQPGTFHILPGTYDKPSTLIVGTSSWWREIDPNQPLLEIPVSSVQVADSIIKDYCNGLLGCNMNDQVPGLFYFPGEWTVDRLKKEQLPILQKYAAFQKKWFTELIRIADILWARSNGNPLSISDDARMACRELNITNKDWLKDSQTIELVRCMACGSLKSSQFPVCPTCKAIADPELAKKLNIQFAQ